MKPKSMGKMQTFGDLIVNVYKAYGKRRAQGILALLLNAHLVGFPGRHRYVVRRGNGKL